MKRKRSDEGKGEGNDRAERKIEGKRNEKEELGIEGKEQASLDLPIAY